MCIMHDGYIIMWTLLTGEFGIVYRARLGSKGMTGQVVAVKTLKGMPWMITPLQIMLI